MRGSRAKQQGVAIGSTAPDFHRTQRPAGPRLVLDHHGLPEHLRHARRIKTRKTIGRPATWKGHDQPQGARRKSLRMGRQACDQRARQHGTSALNELSALK